MSEITPPFNISYGTVVWRAAVDIADTDDVDTIPDYVPPTGTVTLTATTTKELDATATPDPVTILRAPIQGVLDDQGYLCTPNADGTLGARGLKVISTDDPDLNPTGWLYNVTYNLRRAGKVIVSPGTHLLAVPTDGTVDLTTIIPPDAADLIGVPQAEAAAAAAAAAAADAQAAAIAAAAALTDLDPTAADLVADPTSDTGLAVAAKVIAGTKPLLSINPITGYYHADAFGADRTGSSDSAAAINAALAAAPDHSVLYFAPGRYKVTAPVSIPSNRSIEMAPEATIVRAFNTTGNTGGTFINSDQTAGNVNINIRAGRFEAESSARTGKHLSFVKVNGLKIEGPGLYGVYGDWNSTFKNCSNLIIRGLRWDSGAALYTDGIHIYGGSSITISDCILSAGDDALSLTVEAADCDWIQDVTISNMVLNSNNASMIKLAVASTATTGIRRVTMNNIVGSHGPGVGIWSRDLSAAKDRIYDISISNTLINSGSATNTSIYFEGGCKRLSLTNVTAADPNGLPFKMDGGSDLALVNFRTFGQRGASQPGIRLDNVDGFEIRGGTIVGATGVGILLGSSTQVKNGRISGVAVRGATAAGVRFINTDGVTLTGSSISGCSAAYIEDSPSTNNAILSNDLRGNTSVPGSYSASNLVTANNRGVSSSAAPSLIVPPVSIFLAPGFTAWSAANRAVYARFQVATETVVRYVNWGVGTASGNVQVGIVKLKGSGHASYDRIVATAIIACPAAGDVRTDLGATTLAPGDYAAFIWADNTTVTLRSGTSANLPTLRMSAIESSAAGGVSASGALSYSNQYVQLTLEADI